jgi:hypothetical protein
VLSREDENVGKHHHRPPIGSPEAT